MGAGAALVKGGHLTGEEITDLLVTPLGTRAFRHRRIETTSTHGTGCTLSAAVTAEHFAGTDYLQLFEDLIAELPDLQYIVTVGREELWYDDRIFQFEDLISSGEGRPVPAAENVGDDSDLAILYTSGTMGKPKGVRLSHRTIVETALRTGEAIEVEQLSPLSRLRHIRGALAGTLRIAQNRADDGARHSKLDFRLDGQITSGSWDG